MGAQFKVVKIDPEGSGIEWSGHLGSIIDNAKRCCENCSCIWSGEYGPFITGELEPLNDEAKEMLEIIKAFEEKEKQRKPKTLVYTPQYLRAVAKITGKKAPYVKLVK